MKFEEINIELFEECMDTLDRCLTDAKMEKSNMHDVSLLMIHLGFPKCISYCKTFSIGRIFVEMFRLCPSPHV